MVIGRRIAQRKTSLSSHKLFLVFIGVGVFCFGFVLVAYRSSLEQRISYKNLPPVEVAANTTFNSESNAFINPLSEYATKSDSSSSSIKWFRKPNPLLSDWPELENRNQIHLLLEKLNYTRGVEIGVQRGVLAQKTLRKWKSCKHYALVDLWGAEDGYVEPGDVQDTNEMKNSYLKEAKGRLRKYKRITDWYVMRSTDAAKRFQDNYFDYIYVDARHDYCAVTEDIAYYWPKLRPGGVMAGHDFVTAKEAMDALGPQQDWSKCEDGTINARAVRGAVEDFATKHSLRIKVTKEPFPTWLIQKPYADIE